MSSRLAGLNWGWSRKAPAMFAGVFAMLAGSADPAAAQASWIEVTGPHVTVVSDAGDRRARDIAWQFEQVREAVARTFPWVRTETPVPLVVLAARSEASMRALAPRFWEGRQGSSLVSVSQRGRDRSYILLRADVRVEDREGINPYQNAYWAYAAAALNDTSDALPTWLVRGLSSVMSNILVRDDQVQVGRVLPQHLERLRTRSRMTLKEVLAFENTRGVPLDTLEALDAHAWAFVHFLAFAEAGANAPLLDAYVRAVLSGGDPATSLATTIGDVARFERPFAVYVGRALFGYVRIDIAARITREGLSVRQMPAGESAAVRASFHVAMQRPAEARALMAEADKAGPDGIADEARALAAEAEGRDDELTALLERAVTRPTASWYAPYRLATRLTTRGTPALERIETLLLQATSTHASADAAWAYLGEVQAALGRDDAAMASVQRAIALRPAWSGHRVSLARVLWRLDRRPDALRAAGSARAMARTASEREDAQRMLADLAKAANASARGTPAAAEPPTGTASAAAPSPPSATPEAPTPRVPGPSAAEPTGSTGPGAARVDVSTLMNRCLAANDTCEAALPAIVAECEAGGAMSRFACAFAGYALDAGLGVTAEPTRAARYYRMGCERGDQRACIRLASLKAAGSGVPRDVPAALAVLEAACAGGVLEACGRLALVLLNRSEPGDVDRARSLLRTACEAGDEPSCTLQKQLPPGA